jgi:hypothetical protein
MDADTERAAQTAEERAAAALIPLLERVEEFLASDVGREAASVDGAALLHSVEEFLGRFVAYPNAEARAAHVLWVAHTHLMEVWESTPRIAFLSPEPGSGKTRALEVTELLVPRPVESINASPAYLFRKVSDAQGLPTILYDEIDTLFGPTAKDNEEICGLLNAGHRKGAMAGRCIVRGKNIETEELPAYCAVALAGLGNLPDTILTRSVVIRMRRRAPTERVMPYRRRQHAPAGHLLRNELAAWALEIAPTLYGEYPQMPVGVEDRAADKWEPLLAVADAARGDWPKRARDATVALIATAKENTPSFGVRLLMDLRGIFNAHKDKEHLPSETIIDALCALPEAPWGDLRGKRLDARRLANLLRPYSVTSADVRDGERTLKGYKRADLWDAWERYLGSSLSSPSESATSATTATIPTVVRSVAHVAHVADVDGDSWEEF